MFLKSLALKGEQFYMLEITKMDDGDEFRINTNIDTSTKREKSQVFVFSKIHFKMLNK